MEETNTTDDYAYIIDAELCRMDTVKRFGSRFLPLFYSLVFVIGLLGNTLVVWVLFQLKKKKSMTDVYLLNLAISDLLFVFSLPFWAYYASDQWIFGAGMCKIISLTYLLGFYGSAFFIVLMSIDRYLAIVHAVAALKARTVTYGIIVSTVSWAAAICASVPSTVFSTAVVMEYENKTQCRPSYPKSTEKKWKIFNYFEINVLGLIVPLIVMVYCYSRILITLLRCKNYKKHRAVKLIFVVVIVFFVFWTPYNSILFLYSLQELETINDCDTGKNLDYVIQVLEPIAFSHCCLNPVIYAFAGEKFKKQLYGQM
nr:PREDICTED: C-C chemokine receptor type 4-like [Latimeria chalumnae]|eukprot:XP_006003633.2 PREDICTED: C-C chemokine receptor type 4-like [Latimeria chalumnae]